MFALYHFFWMLRILLLYISVYWFLHEQVFISPGCTPKSGISRSYGNSICSILRDHQTVFHCGSTILHSHKQCMRFPISPHSCQSVLVIFLFCCCCCLAIIMGMKCKCKHIVIFFKHLYWSIIALQWCVSFCCTAKWISYTYTYIPISPPSCVSLPPSLSHPSRWSQSTELISLCYAAASH